MTGTSYATSAEMAGELGPFPGFKPNSDHMLRVIRNHRRAAYGETDGYEALNTFRPVALDIENCPDAALCRAAGRKAWDRALELARKHGYRNAQATVIAPTGTIGLVMDCDTTGIEPDFALVKFKKLAGGGYFKIINRMVPDGAHRARLQRKPRSKDDHRLCGRPRHASTMHRASTTARSRPRASPAESFEALEGGRARPAFDIKFAFNRFTLGDEFCTDDPRRFSTSKLERPVRHAGRARLFQGRHRGRQHSIVAAR